MIRRNDSDSRHTRRHTPQEAFVRLCRYCAYQERSHKEVRSKLFTLGLYASEVEAVITRLITEGFLSEERFAKAFAGGKFRMNKWGRQKIKRAMEDHGLSPRFIQYGLKEIDASSYTRTLSALLSKKLKSLHEPSMIKRRHKAAAFVIGKGYEADLVWEILKEIDA